MPLPSFLQRKDKKPAERKAAPASSAVPAEDSEAVLAARTRARRRLIGAVVLLALGVTGFPLLFETQPRPVALDTPIELPAGKSAPLAARPPSAVTRAPLPVVTEAPVETIIEPAASPTPAAAMSSAPVPAPASVPAPKPTPAPAPVAPSAAAPPKPDEGARARALLEGGAASTGKTARFVVQVGAYSEAGALHDARAKVEAQGLKTYTQIIETEAGKRTTRVRVGPFSSREEAEGAANKLKAAGMPGQILVL
jgi:DedD protein